MQYSLALTESASTLKTASGVSPGFRNSINAQSQWINKKNISADGKYVITGSCNPFKIDGQFSQAHSKIGCVNDRNDPTVSLFKENGELLETLPGWLGLFSPDGKFILTAGDINQFGLYNIHIWKKNGRPINSFNIGTNISAAWVKNP